MMSRDTAALPFEKPSDRELYTRVVVAFISAGSKVLAAFLIALSNLRDFTSQLVDHPTPYMIWKLTLRAASAVYPLITLTLFLATLEEYMGRVYAYYRYLEHGIFIDFKNREGLWSFVCKSWLLKYVVASTLLMGWQVYVEQCPGAFDSIGKCDVPWASLIAVATLALLFIGDLYALRQFEVNQLVSLSKYVEVQGLESAASHLAQGVLVEEEIVSNQWRRARAILKHGLKGLSDPAEVASHLAGWQAEGKLVDFSAVPSCTKGELTDVPGAKAGRCMVASAWATQQGNTDAKLNAIFFNPRDGSFYTCLARVANCCGFGVLALEVYGACLVVVPMLMEVSNSTASGSNATLVATAYNDSMLVDASI